jgi:putative transposase
MGVTIQFESHRVELAATFEMEHDRRHWSFTISPKQLRWITTTQASDYLVLRQDAAGWEEWKTEDELNRLAEHSPNRYRQETDRSHCHP